MTLDTTAHVASHELATEIDNITEAQQKIDGEFYNKLISLTRNVASKFSVSPKLVVEAFKVNYGGTPPVYAKKLLEGAVLNESTGINLPVSEDTKFGTLNIVNEHILDQALDAYFSSTSKGIDTKEAVAKVKEDYDMTLAEFQEFSKRIKAKEEEKKKVVDISTGDKGETVATKGDNVIVKGDDGKTKNVPKKYIRNECIYFDDNAQAEQATGMLMYKGIPWQSRGQDDDKHYIQFDSPETTDKAYGALSRKWDFVDQDPKKVAKIEFDNMADFQKVMDFMLKQGMVMDFGGEEELDEDLSFATRFQKGKNALLKKAGSRRLPKVNMDLNRPRGWMAKPRAVAPDNLDEMFEDSKNRQIKIRKKWKPE